MKFVEVRLCLVVGAQATGISVQQVLEQITSRLTTSPCLFFLHRFLLSTLHHWLSFPSLPRAAPSAWRSGGQWWSGTQTASSSCRQTNPSTNQDRLVNVHFAYNMGLRREFLQTEFLCLVFFRLSYILGSFFRVTVKTITVICCGA